MHPIKPRSNLWFLAPLLFGIIGGIVAFFILRRDDPIKARNCLIVGVGMMVVGIMIDVMLMPQITGITEGIKVNS